MKTWKKIGIGLLIIVVVLGIWFYPKYQMLSHTMHLFDEDRIINNFRTFDSIWPVSVLEAPSKKYLYPYADEISLPLDFEFEGERLNTSQFLIDGWTTGLLVIQSDSIVIENYYLENTETTQNISWSMAKSFISALMGVAVEEGHIKDINDNVEDYVPELVGTAYDGVRIKDVLQMSTGVRFNEDYGDFYSDINKWGRGFALGQSQDKFAASLERELEPGTVNRYISINTHVLGMILTRATGKTVTEYMQQKLFDPMGMEYDGYWLLDGKNMEMVLGGLNLTLRDFAKIGSLFVNNGFFNEDQIISKEWVSTSVTPDGSHLQPSEKFGYGYQWWIPESIEGEYMAIGVYNQYVYVNPKTKTVIAKLSANPKFNDKSYPPSNHYASLEMFRAIAATLASPVEKKEGVLSLSE